MDAKITAAGFHDGSSSHGSGTNPGSSSNNPNVARETGASGGGSILNRRPMDRRPSLGDSSLHTLNLQGERSSDEEAAEYYSCSSGSEGEGSRNGSSETLSEHEDEKSVVVNAARGGWLSGLMGRSGRKEKKDNEIVHRGRKNATGILSPPNFDPSSSSSSDNDTTLSSKAAGAATAASVASRRGDGGDLHRQRSSSSVRRSSLDEDDDLVRPYHRAFRNNERPSFLRRSPMGALRIMGSDDMYHDAKSSSNKTSSKGAARAGSSAAGSGSSGSNLHSSNDSHLGQSLSYSAGEDSSSSSPSSSGEHNISKFSSGYQKHTHKNKKKKGDDLSLMITTKTTRRCRRILPILAATCLLLAAGSAATFFFVFSGDRAALRTSAEQLFQRSRETEEKNFMNNNGGGQLFLPPLSSTSSDLENCISNGHFDEEPATSHWYSVRSDLTTVTDSYDEGHHHHALLATDRTNARIGGMWQNIRSDCLQPNTWYEVQADVLLRRAGTQETIDCDPSIPWFTHERSCPSIALKTSTNLLQDIACTVGPLSTSYHHFGWYRLYGSFRPTEDMVQTQVAVLIARAPTDADIMVDNIQINPANEYTLGVVQDCSSSNLIANGNADTGDHRYWWIRGNGGESGSIEVPNTEERGYVFRHAGNRGERWRGMLQTLNAKYCLTPNSRWRISAIFRYFKTNEDGVDEPMMCDKSNPMAVDSCPVFEFQFFSPEASSAVVNTGPLMNEDTEEFIFGGWNRIVHTLTVSDEMAMQSDVWFYVQSVEKRFNYEIDDIEMVMVV